MKGNLTRIDRTIRIFLAEEMPTWLGTMGRGWTSAVSALSVLRAQFNFSTKGIVTHSQSRGGEAGAQPTFFMSARLKPLETLNLSLAIPSETQSC